MEAPKFRFYDNIEELINEFSEIKKDWYLIKNNKKVKFPEYTDSKIEELEYLIKNKPDIALIKALNIMSELDNVHLKSGVDLNYILSFSTTSERVKYFIEYNQFLSDDEFWMNLANVYMSQDYNPIPYEILYNLFNSKRTKKKFDE